MIKNLIKCVVKTGILYRNDQFSAAELQLADDFKRKFRHVAMTVVSFHTVDFSYDRAFLCSALEDCGSMLRRLVARHLTEKSLGRVDHVFAFFANKEFLDTAFKPDGPHRELMGRIVEDLGRLIDGYIV